jgi:hypothetical protein
MYGFKDSSEVGPGKSGGNFGLNTNVNVTKFEYNANAGRDGAAGDAIDFNVQIGEREYMHRFFPVAKVFSKEGGEITDTTSDAYKEEFGKAMALFNAALSDIVKCFAAEEDIKQALLTPINSFADYAKILERLVKSNANWAKQPVDVFLEYQWKPSGENTRTFLTLPKNVKQGSFIQKSMPGMKFTEDKTDSHIKYVAEDGSIHPFKRGKWYVESAFANQTILEDNSSANASMNGATTGSDTW